MNKITQIWKTINESARIVIYITLLVIIVWGITRLGSCNSEFTPTEINTEINEELEIRIAYLEGTLSQANKEKVKALQELDSVKNEKPKIILKVRNMTEVEKDRLIMEAIGVALSDSIDSLRNNISEYIADCESTTEILTYTEIALQKSELELSSCKDVKDTQAELITTQNNQIDTLSNDIVNCTTKNQKLITKNKKGFWKGVVIGVLSTIGISQVTK